MKRFELEDNPFRCNGIKDHQGERYLKPREIEEMLNSQRDLIRNLERENSVLRADLRQYHSCCCDGSDKIIEEAFDAYLDKQEEKFLMTMTEELIFKDIKNFIISYLKKRLKYDGR